MSAQQGRSSHHVQLCCRPQPGRDGAQCPQWRTDWLRLPDPALSDQVPGEVRGGVPPGVRRGGGHHLHPGVPGHRDQALHQGPRGPAWLLEERGGAQLQQWPLRARLPGRCGAPVPGGSPGDGEGGGPPGLQSGGGRRPPPGLWLLSRLRLQVTPGPRVRLRSLGPGPGPGPGPGQE